MPAASSCCGRGATSQVKLWIWRRVGTTRRLCSSIAVVPLMKRSSSLMARTSASVGTTLCTRLRSMKNWMPSRASGVSIVRVIDQFAPGLPDEGREADQAVLDSQAMLIGETVAVDVDRQRFGGGEKIVPGPARFRVWHASGVEQIAVEVDDQTREILGQAHQFAVELERLQWLRIVVLLVQDLARFEKWSDRHQRVARGELTVAAGGVKEKGGGETGRGARP